jgi:hypothetical protein
VSAAEHLSRALHAASRAAALAGCAADAACVAQLRDATRTALRLLDASLVAFAGDDVSDDRATLLTVARRHVEAAFVELNCVTHVSRTVQRAVLRNTRQDCADALAAMDLRTPRNNVTALHHRIARGA